MASLIIIGWLLGTVWAFRHLAEWSELRDMGDTDAELWMSGGLIMLMSLIGWPLVAVFIPIRGVYRKIKHTFPDASNRWVDWYFATTRDARKEALRK